MVIKILFPDLVQLCVLSPFVLPDGAAAGVLPVPDVCDGVSPRDPAG